MGVITVAPSRPLSIPGALKALIVDPLEDDRPDDEIVTTTRRALNRLALVATETAGRFQRDGIDYDPMTWMLSPRRLFGGRPAVDACLEREHCLRGVLTHGLGLGLDSDPEVVDELLAEEDNGEFDDEWGEPERMPAKGNGLRGYFDSPKLITATICYSDRHVILNAFHASVVSNPSEVTQHLIDRYGIDVMPSARIWHGYKAADPLVMALVPDPIAEMILKIEAEQWLPIHDNFAIDLEQRIQN